MSIISNVITSADSPFKNIISDFGGVRRPWIGSTEDPLYKKYKFNTGIDLYGSTVYSYANGVVLAVGREGRHYAVTVQYDVFSCIRYTNLEQVSVSRGDIIQTAFQIGRADKYVHLEYATKEKLSSLWPVRVGTEVYYKQNPLTMVGDDI